MRKFPRGAVANVERQQSHRDFVQAAKPEYVIMRITHARRLMDDGMTFDDYYPESVNVITTTTVPDNKLELLAWEREEEELKKFSEIDIVREVQPDYHIPTDYSLYRGMTEEEQFNAVQQCVRGTRWMYENTEDMDVTLIPLIKGLTKDQRQLFYELYDEVGVDYAAFYATQYFTSDTDVQYKELYGDLEQIKAESDIDLFVMGAFSPQLLRRLPNNVVAASGQRQWRESCNPRNNDANSIREEWNALAEEINDALSHNPNSDYKYV